MKFTFNILWLCRSKKNLIIYYIRTNLTHFPHVPLISSKPTTLILKGNLIWRHWKYRGCTSIHDFCKSVLTGPSGYCVAVTVNFQLLLRLFLFQFPTRASLSEGMIPVLYHDKVPIRTPGETINAVLLSIFLTCQESSSHAELVQ